MVKNNYVKGGDVTHFYSDRCKVTIEQWPSGKLRWEISVAGENPTDTLQQIYEIEENINKRYK
jgi:hypothetical protein